MTTAHKTERAARFAAYSAALASWHKSSARSELAAAMQLATVRLRDVQPTAAPLVVHVEVIL